MKRTAHATALLSLSILIAFSLFASAPTPLARAQSPVFAGSSEQAPTGSDTEVSFESGGLTFYGSLRTPVGETRSVAALLLPGSGPTDRNGNQAQSGYHPGTLSNLANTLAAHGVPSLRFDKIGSGRTGFGGRSAEEVDYGFEDQVDHADAALSLLQELTGRAPERILLLGHSEGALTALTLDRRHGLALLEPLPIRYLDLLSAQVSSSLSRNVQEGRIPAAEAETIRTDLGHTVESLRTHGTVPAEQHPFLSQIGLTPQNARFLSEADRYDPAELASHLPDSTRVLLTCSDKDLNVSCGQTEALVSAISPAALDFVHLTTANHMLGELGPLPSGTLDAMTPLPLSFEFERELKAWIDDISRG